MKLRQRASPQCILHMSKLTVTVLNRTSVPDILLDWRPLKAAVLRKILAEVEYAIILEETHVERIVQIEILK